jgi:type IX secretion system PorP/SprF family membrane protein
MLIFAYNDIYMLRKFLVIFLTFFFTNITLSQEQSIYKQAYLDPFFINPACAGSALFPVARLSVEKRWIGFRDSPSTLLLSGNTRFGSYDFYTPKGLVNKGPLKTGGRTAVGGVVYYDDNGPINSTGGNLTYAYHMSLNRVSRLSMGLSVFMVNKSINTSQLEPDQIADDYLLSPQNDLFRVNFGIGVFYYTSAFFSGISVSELFPVENNDNTFGKVNMPGYHFIAGYKFEEVFPAFDIEPSLIASKYDDEEANFDFFARVYFINFHWAAISYSTRRQAEIMLAVKIFESFYLGYNYMYTLGRIASYNSGSHRISIGINLGLRGAENQPNYF